MHTCSHVQIYLFLQLQLFSGSDLIDLVHLLQPLRPKTNVVDVCSACM